MSPFLEDLPPLDAHAHLAPDVTVAQLRGLEGAHVFGVTRTLAEAEYVSTRSDDAVTWGLGMHPTSYRSLASFDGRAFGRLINSFALVGEVGLDFRGGSRQVKVLHEILRLCQDQPVLLSVHSTGMVHEVLDALTAFPNRGAILHWFAGGPSEIAAAEQLGCYFSVNAAMTDDQISALPRERLLPETDFPGAGKAGASRPGDIDALELRLAELWAVERDVLRHRLYANLRRIATVTAAIERMPATFAGHILAA